jgi:hypothetical protein
MKPVFKRIGSDIEFTWEDNNVYALVRYITKHKGNKITAEVEINLNPDRTKSNNQIDLIQSEVNLLSIKSKNELIAELEKRTLNEKRSPDVLWQTLIDQVFKYSLKSFREGDPVKELQATGEIKPPIYLLEPFLYEAKPNLFFGEGGTSKSYLAMAFSLLIQNGLKQNSLSLPLKQVNTLYLDYECDADEMTRRLEYLTKGLDLPKNPFVYRECSMPFVEDFEAIEKIVTERNIKLIVIDSLGIALGNNNLNEAQPVTNFFSTLRRLKVTSLLITHISKGTQNGNHKPSPFGSVYFTNLARNVWEVRKGQEVGEDTIDIAFFHRKNNQGRLHYPLGLRLQFKDDSISLDPISIDEVPEFIDTLSLKCRIKNILKETGKLTVKDIAERLNANSDSVRVKLNSNKDLFVKLDDTWGLLSKNDNN